MAVGQLEECYLGISVHTPDRTERQRKPAFRTYHKMACLPDPNTR